MAAQLTQHLFLGGLPSGLKFTLREVTPSVPDQSGWKAEFESVAGNAWRYPHANRNSVRLPYEIPPGGHIGFVALHGEPFTGSGQGGKVDFKFCIEGTTMVNGASVAVNNEGYFSVSATDWGRIQRPDISNVTYYWPGAAPVNAPLSVPATIHGNPDDIYFVFAMNPDNKEIGMNATTHKEVIQTAIDYVLKGIFYAHEKLFGWTVGKVNPLW